MIRPHLRSILSLIGFAAIGIGCGETPPMAVVDMAAVEDAEELDLVAPIDLVPPADLVFPLDLTRCPGQKWCERLMR